MSSESLGSEDAVHFHWRDGLPADEYAVATYRIETVADPEAAAVAIAREQSATTLRMTGVDPGAIARATARVISVEALGEVEEAMLPTFHLRTHSYPDRSPVASRIRAARVRVAFPVRNFGASLTGLWNTVVGEVHRLGFLTAARVEDLELPAPLLEWMPGPRHGVAGLRRLSGVAGRPWFCRATRPATGLTTEEMVRINEAVLRGGFDAVKDDELTYETPLSPFRERVTRMMAMVRRVEDATGERKLYFAQALDDPERAREHADFAARAGVAGLLVAPMLQGLAVCADLGRRTGLAMLAHNAGADGLTRHPRWGVHPALWCRVQRWFGADLVFLPGNFGLEAAAERDENRRCLAACAGASGRVEAAVPVLAGGKTPDGLRGHREAVGSADFLLIAASAVDLHPGGLEAGARAFREAWRGVE